MKRLFLLTSAFLLAMTITAVPAKKGIKRVLTLDNGTQVTAELQGDEFLSFWKADNGECYMLTNGQQEVYQVADIPALQVKADQLRKESNARRAKRLQATRKNDFGGDHPVYENVKKGLIILVYYTDIQFGKTHNQKFYQRVANERHFTSSIGFKGSVKDYFLDQSNGRFELDFDVVGPYKLDHEVAYYGAHDGGNNDKRPGRMIADACAKADADVDFSQYDWNGDGRVEQIYVLYAGLGEAAGGASTTIWPHEWSLSSSDYGTQYVTNDGETFVDTYSCGAELTKNYLGNNTADGIGTICHEFSHCLGLPDMYDTRQSQEYGMGSWDLMAHGSYNDGGFCPPNYSTYEKWQTGWIEPVILFEPTTVKGVPAQAVDYGKTFVIYNDDNPDECYLLENRQTNVGIWDTKMPGSGLMIQHLDFNSTIWSMNNVNAIVNYSEQYGPQYAYMDNDHQRCTIYHADNTAGVANETTDLYPYEGNNSLTATSTPAAICYTGTSLLSKPITNIVQNDDGTIDFDFMGGSSTNIIIVTAIDAITVNKPVQNDNSWYTIDGQRLNGEPTQRGIYIHNGQKFVVK